MTRLHLAVEKGDMSTVKYLVDRGDDVNIRDNNGVCLSRSVYVKSLVQRLDTCIHTKNCSLRNKSIRISVIQLESSDNREKLL